MFDYGNKMKKYFEILIITFAIQFAGLTVSSIIYKYYKSLNKLNNIGAAVVVASILVAIIVDIVLAIRWGSNIKQKLIYIFLMPTNYLWLAFIIWTFWYIGEWIDMIEHIHH